MAEVQKTTQSGELSQRFIEFVVMHAQNAALFLGQIPNPKTGEAEVNLDLARMFIDQLAMIQEKTRGNLTNEEATVLRNTLSNLQMAYVEAAGEKPEGAAQPEPAAAASPKRAEKFCINLVRSVKRPLLILSAFGIGVLFTALTAALSYFASQAGAELASEILFWPNTLMQSLVPLHNIGTTTHPLYEGTALNIVAFFVSFPLAFLVYGTATYIFFRRWQRYHGIQARLVR